MNRPMNAAGKFQMPTAADLGILFLGTAWAIGYGYVRRLGFGEECCLAPQRTIASMLNRFKESIHEPHLEPLYIDYSFYGAIHQRCIFCAVQCYRVGVAR